MYVVREPPWIAAGNVPRARAAVAPRRTWRAWALGERGCAKVADRTGSG
jgi:hypothetical protein